MSLCISEDECVCEIRYSTHPPQPFLYEATDAPKLAALPSPLLRTVDAIALEVQAVINYGRWICR